MNTESYDAGFIDGYLEGMNVVLKKPDKFGLRTK